jgi:hypothetical protein
VKAALPTVFDLSGNVDGVGLRHGTLPGLRAGAQNRSLSHQLPDDADDVTKMGAGSPNSEFFLFVRHGPCGIEGCVLLRQIEFRPNDVASPRVCVGLTTFSPVSIDELVARVRSLPEHVCDGSIYSPMR